MSALERILRELESATAVAADPGENFAAIREALERRQRALAALSEVADVPQTLSAEEREDVLRRLRLVSEAGDLAEQWLMASKSDAMTEWNQWSHIYRALGAAASAKPTVVDCRG